MEQIERLPIFIGLLIVMMLWEVLAPKRTITQSRWQRWSANFSLSILSALLMRFSLAGAALWASAIVTEQHLGLLQLFNMPIWLSIVLALILLDLAIYGQHRLSHYWPLLWRLHKVHHSDQAFDVTTAIRFHPIEITFSMCYKVIVIFIIGANIHSVLLFEVILSSCALFNHSNISIPISIDKYLRLLIVTPDMHRVHHSVINAETNSNYGFSISIWDRLFNSYIPQPEQGHDGVVIGLSQYQQADDISLKRLILMPFTRP